jgi:hypothetical protein
MKWWKSSSFVLSVLFLSLAAKKTRRWLANFLLLCEARFLPITSRAQRWAALLETQRSFCCANGMGVRGCADFAHFSARWLGNNNLLMRVIKIESEWHEVDDTWQWKNNADGKLLLQNAFASPLSCYKIMAGWLGNH